VRFLSVNIKTTMRIVIKSFAAGILSATSLTCCGQPVITNQPQNQTVLAGATATFSVGATGTPPLSYQWVFNTLNNRLPGATNDTLILPNVQASNAGNYRVTITNDAGSVLSGSGRLTVVTPPVITPANPTASLFADVTLLATNVSAGAISSQWLFNGEPIAGAVTNRLVVTNVQKTNAGAYAFVVTYAFGSVTSQVATLKIVPFNSMYCFGFSWTDTQAASHGCGGPTVCPTCYWQGRYSNGTMWPEFLSTNLGLAYVAANNYAVCGGGSSWVLNQVNSTFVAPKQPKLSAYFLWQSFDDFTSQTATNEAAFLNSMRVQTQNFSNALDRLYVAGAREIIVETILVGNGAALPIDLSAFGTNSDAIDHYIQATSRLNAAVLDTV